MEQVMYGPPHVHMVPHMYDLMVPPYLIWNRYHMVPPHVVCSPHKYDMFFSGQLRKSPLRVLMIPPQNAPHISIPKGIPFFRFKQVFVTNSTKSALVLEAVRPAGISHFFLTEQDFENKCLWIKYYLLLPFCSHI